MQSPKACYIGRRIRQARWQGASHVARIWSALQYGRSGTGATCGVSRAAADRSGMPTRGVNILFRSIMGATGQTGAPSRHATPPTMPVELIDCQPPCYTATKITLSDILRLLEGRSADADWCGGAHKPGSARIPPAVSRWADPRWTVPAGTDLSRPILLVVQSRIISGWNSSYCRPSYQR